MHEMIQGSTVITVTNYAATHGCDAFRAYVTALDASFVGRKRSGVYLIQCTRQVMSGISAFAGFDALLVAQKPGSAPVWMVQRAAAVTIVDARC